MHSFLPTNTGLYGGITSGRGIPDYPMPTQTIGGKGKQYTGETRKAKIAAEDHAATICENAACCCDSVAVRWQGYDSYKGNAEVVVPCN